MTSSTHTKIDLLASQKINSKVELHTFIWGSSLMFGWNKVGQTILLIIFSTLVSLPMSAAEQGLDHCSNFNWRKIPSNQWVQLSTCGDVPRKVFHGASALAADRNEIFFFGADTHQKDYNNSVYRLNLSNLAWSKDYEADPIEDYRLTEDGYAVTTAGRPWAMHTFDAWDYAPVVQKLISTSSPRHAYKAFEQLSERGNVRNKIKSATWLYDPDTKEWQLAKANTPYLFARGQVWDPVGNQLIGHNGDTTSHYDPLHKQWVTYSKPTVSGWHRKLVFDSFSERVLSLGHHESSNDLWSYSPKSLKWKKVAVPTLPLPANGAAMAYDTHQHVLLYLANDSPNQYSNPSGKSVTFMYFSEVQNWMRLSVQSPPLYGMNYLLQYDPVHKVFLHFERAPESGGRLAVWTFRYQHIP